MNGNATRLTALLLLAAAWTASAQRRGIRTCSCQIGNGLSQRGKLVGSLCYVVGVGSCHSFIYDAGSQQPQARSQRRFDQNRFQTRSGFQSRFDSNRPARFISSHPSRFSQQNQFQSANQFNSQNQFSVNRRYQPSRFSSRPSRFNIPAAVATATPDQHRAAAEDARRQLESQRSFERDLISAGVTVRPGSPEAALANERRPNKKSVELGNKALAQILYLQSLLGRSGRR